MKIVCLLLAAVLISCTGAAEKGPVIPAGPSSSFQEFIDMLNRASADRLIALIDSFITAASSTGLPLVEDTLAHFIYKGPTSSAVSIPGDFNGWDAAADYMIKIDGTDFHYRTKIFEPDARLDYKYVINGSQWILDALNPNTVTGGFGPNSELAMGAYLQPEEIEPHPEIPHGTIESLTFHSAVLGNNRRVQIYLPPGYAADTLQHYPSIYIHDGGEYLSLANMNNVLDYLINRRDIGSLIAVFVDPVDRNSEYWLNESYQNMMINELVPQVDSTFRTMDDPSHRATMGASLGGLISAFIAYNHPDVFGLCAGQSSAFHVDDSRIIHTLSAGPRKNIRFYLDWGTYEPSIRQSNLAMLDVLQSKGYSVNSFEYHEGHSWGSWRAHTDDILKTLF